MGHLTFIACIQCDGEGYDRGVYECEACDGTGNQKCEARGCKENAVCFNEDGDAMCEDCFTEWCGRVHARS